MTLCCVDVDTFGPWLVVVRGKGRGRGFACGLEADVCSSPQSCATPIFTLDLHILAENWSLRKIAGSKLFVLCSQMSTRLK